MKQWSLRFLAALVAVLAFAEVTLSFSGIADVPLYKANNKIGFIPKANQSGFFLHRHGWAFNELSMGTARSFAPTADKMDILLVGDSIVLGGNAYEPSERLGSQLELATGATVWPVSASSWGFQNELAYLRKHPEVIDAVDHVVFVLNSSNFDQPSSWMTEFLHPRGRPVSTALFAFERYVLKPTGPFKPPPELEVEKRDWATDFRAVFGANSKPITIVLYPDREEESQSSLAESRLNFRKDQLLALDPDTRAVIAISKDGRWNTTLYQDDVHPTVQGTAILAKLIADGIPHSDN